MRPGWCFVGVLCLALLAATPSSVVAGSVAESCTVFMITDGMTVLGGGNEDQGDFPARAWFIPASRGKYGSVYFGFEHVAKSGMNDQGLFYDSLSVPDIEVGMEEGKEIHPGMWSMYALETCATVDEVVALVESISIPGTWTDKLFFGDRTGHSIVVEGKQILYPKRNYQVSTNFLESTTPPSEITSERYLTAKQMLNEMSVVSLDAVRDVLAATAVTYADGSGTAYSAIYDPVGTTAIVYFWRDFEHPIYFDLDKELAKGAHVEELADLAPASALRDAWVSDAQAALDSAIEERIDRTVDLGVDRSDLVGQYAVDPEIGFVPIPPVMLTGASVVWDGETPLLVVAPEGIAFELYPAGNDVWFHANVTQMPEMDFTLHRDENGQVDGASLLVAGLGEIPFVKTGSKPLFQPLPTNPFVPGETESAPELRRSALMWLAVAAGLFVAAALALVLRN